MIMYKEKNKTTILCSKINADLIQVLDSCNRLQVQIFLLQATTFNVFWLQLLTTINSAEIIRGNPIFKVV